MDIFRFENESDTVYNYRLLFITKNKDKFDNHTLIKYSKILSNIKFKNCKYDSKIYNILKEYK